MDKILAWLFIALVYGLASAAIVWCLLSEENSK
jgi:hypothetical protein